MKEARDIAGIITVDAAYRIIYRYIKNGYTLYDPKNPSHQKLRLNRKPFLP